MDEKVTELLIDKYKLYLGNLRPDIRRRRASYAFFANIVCTRNFIPVQCIINNFVRTLFLKHSCVKVAIYV